MAWLPRRKRGAGSDTLGGDGGHEGVGVRGSAPVGSAPVGSAPVGSAPVGTEPDGSGASWTGTEPTTSAVTEDLRVAEDSLLDTIALTPSGGLMPDPFGADRHPAPGGTAGAPSDGDVVAGQGDSFVKGVFQAGPLAIGGLVASGLNIVATVLIARLLTPRQYGGVAQLLGLFFVLSMPGSALLVGVVRRIAAAAVQGRQEEVHQWTNRLARRCLIGLAVWVVFALAIEAPLASALRLPTSGGVAAVLIAGGVWLVLCLYRAILQGHRRYAGLGLNLMVEIGIRVVFVLSFAAAGFGIPGFALGLLLGEIVATVHARYLAGRAWDYPAADSLAPDLEARDRTLSIDLSVAFVGFVLLGILQNADIILVGRLDPASSGSYAAISVASKSLVFGAILLGSYVLPEAALRWHQGQHALRQVAVTLVFLLVPSVVLLGIALVAPEWFLTTFFSAKLNGAASAFATLVGAMACLGLVVILTNYLFGAARRWIVALLAVGVAVLLVLIHLAHGAIVATARAELAVQGGLALAVAVAFAVVHLHWWRTSRSTGPEGGVTSIGRRDPGGSV
jgi:O-antigen/teichoic acid export membrane protein